MSRCHVLAVIAAGMAWIGVAEILDGDIFLGANTLVIVMICLLVSTEPFPPSVQSDKALPSDDLPTPVPTGRGAGATDRIG